MCHWNVSLKSIDQLFNGEVVCFLGGRDRIFKYYLDEQEF
jgi:hypothetical protein